MDAWPDASTFLTQRRNGAEQGRARSPLRAEIQTPENLRRAEDCPPYQCNCHSVRASTPAEIRSGQRYYLQAFTAPVLWHPKNDLKAVLLTSWHCGQDGRAPEHKKASRNDSHHSAASLMQRRNGAEQGRARPACAGRAAIHSPGNCPAGRGLPVLPGQLSQRAPLRGAV